MSPSRLDDWVECVDREDRVDTAPPSEVQRVPASRGVASIVMQPV